MVKDFTPLKATERLSKVIIDFGPIKCPNSYKIPPDGIRKGDWVIYLTDHQMLQVKEQLKLRTAVDSINVTQAMIQSKAIRFA